MIKTIRSRVKDPMADGTKTSLILVALPNQCKKPAYGRLSAHLHVRVGVLEAPHRDADAGVFLLVCWCWCA